MRDRSAPGFIARSRRTIDTVLPRKAAGCGNLSDVELGLDACDAVEQFDDLANQAVELNFEIDKSGVDTVESSVLAVEA